MFLIVATALSVLFIQKQYSANQYKYLAHFLNSGSFLLHGRCSISDSHTDENIPTWQMSEKKPMKKLSPVALKSVTNSFRIFLTKYSA